MSGILLLIVTAVSTRLAANLCVMNNRLKADNVKHRMIKKVYPDIALWADTTYSNNPQKVEIVNERFEEQQKFTKSGSYNMRKRSRR